MKRWPGDAISRTSTFGSMPVTAPETKGRIGGEGVADVPSVVIKIGGSVLERLHSSFYEACVSLNKRGVRVTVVHGGGPVINRLLERSGIRPRFVRGLRVTDAETLSWVQMALAGLRSEERRVGKECRLLRGQHRTKIGIAALTMGQEEDLDNDHNM